MVTCKHPWILLSYIVKTLIEVTLLVRGTHLLSHIKPSPEGVLSLPHAVQVVVPPLTLQVVQLAIMLSQSENTMTHLLNMQHEKGQSSNKSKQFDIILILYFT